MTTFRRGDVVLVRFPHADLTGWTRRPALVVQSDKLHTELGHIVLAQITTTKRSGKTRVLVQAATPEGQQMGLLRDSVIVVDMLQATRSVLLERRLGSCQIMDRVDVALRVVLGLSES